MKISLFRYKSMKRESSRFCENNNNTVSHGICACFDYFFLALVLVWLAIIASQIHLTLLNTSHPRTTKRLNWKFQIRKLVRQRELLNETVCFLSNYLQKQRQILCLSFVRLVFWRDFSRQIKELATTSSDVLLFL